jgi:hypothetical protein
MRKFIAALVLLTAASAVIRPHLDSARLLAARSAYIPDTLPAQISDRDFWELISSISEPGGAFPYENFVSNETSIQQVIPALREVVKPGGVYLGVGPEQNFTYVSALQSKLAFIVDIRRQNMLELLLYKALFDLSSDRAEFVSRLFSRQRPANVNAKSTAEKMLEAYVAAPRDAVGYRQNLKDIEDSLVKKHGFKLTADDLITIEYVYNVFYRGGPAMNYEYASPAPATNTPSYVNMMTATDNNGRNWAYLATEESFQYVRQMQQLNLIVPLVGDFAGPKSIRGVSRYLKEHNATVAAFYISNVEAYLQSGTTWNDFYANVGTLPVDSSSMFIRFVDLNNTRYLKPPSRVWVSKVSSMSELIDLFNAGRLPGYHDVLGMLK